MRKKRWNCNLQIPTNEKVEHQLEVVRGQLDHGLQKFAKTLEVQRVVRVPHRSPAENADARAKVDSGWKYDNI